MVEKGSFGEYQIGGVYEHYKGNYYKVVALAFLHDSQNIYLVIYHQCSKEGVYISIERTHQPFATHETRWNDDVLDKSGNKVKRFKLI